MSETWEYCTTTVTAARSPEGSAAAARIGFDDSHMPAYSAEWMIPALNWYGMRGWELVNMQPVVVGENGDVAAFRFSGVATGIWTHSYLCAFKRRLPSP